MKTYCVVTAPPTDEQIEAAIEKRETVRTSLDGTLAVLKWVGETPAAFEGLEVLDHAGALALMQTPEWMHTVPLEEDEEVIDLTTLTTSELRAMAKEEGITGYSSMRKSELIEALADEEEE